MFWIDSLFLDQGLANTCQIPESLVITNFNRIDASGNQRCIALPFCERNCPPCCWPDRPRGHRSWHSTSSQLCLNLAVVLCDRLAAWHHPHLNFLTAHLIISYTFIVTGRIRSDTWKRDEGGGQSAGHWGAESVGLVCVKFVNSEIVWAFLLGM